MAGRLLWCGAAMAFSCSVVALEPVPIFDASKYTTTAARHAHGVLQMVKAPGAQPLPVLHLHGSAAQRGEAAGVLMAETIANFATKSVDTYVQGILQQINLNGLPKWLQKAIKFAGKKMGPSVLQDVLGWVRDRQLKYVVDAHNQTTQILDEIAGIAKGVCETLGTDRCKSELGSEEKFRDRLERVNWIPELIRMSCSMIGATRSATPHHQLVQLRTLDFGSVPFANFGMLVVHHKTGLDSGIEGAAATPDAFAMVTFPGMVGAVTGFNSAGLIQSEKVSFDAKSVGYNTTCVKPLGVNMRDGCIPGSYKGEGLPFVIRRFIETSKTKEDAESLLMSAKRTWHVYLGLGDSTSMDFDVVGYSQPRVKVWTHDTLPLLTNRSAIKDVSFLDKHVQPESSPVLHDLLASMVGNLTGSVVASVIPHATGSGDVHTMVVDHGEKKFYVALGTTTADGSKYIRKACDAPVLSFDLASLWTMPNDADRITV